MVNNTTPGVYPIISAGGISGSFRNISVSGPIDQGCQNYGTVNDGSTLSVLITACPTENVPGTSMSLAELAGIVVGSVVGGAILIVAGIWFGWRYLHHRWCLDATEKEDVSFR